eukprot:351692-Chlamydomonas_euryale.AAC.1
MLACVPAAFQASRRLFPPVVGAAFQTFRRMHPPVVAAAGRHRKGEACGVGRRTVAACSLGAHGMCTLSDRGAAQSSRLKQMPGASKQRAVAHQSNKAPVDAEGWDKAHLVAKAKCGNRPTAARAGQPLSLGPHGHSQPSIDYAHERMRRPH